jgi:hypothetical protein
MLKAFWSDAGVQNAAGSAFGRVKALSTTPWKAEFSVDSGNSVLEGAIPQTFSHNNLWIMASNAQDVQDRQTVIRAGAELPKRYILS